MARRQCCAPLSVLVAPGSRPCRWGHVSWFGAPRTHPFRCLRRAYVIASIASVHATLPHGERTTYLEHAARGLGVHLSTVYRWMQPFRREARGRLKAYMATDIAIEARAAAALTST